MDPDTAERVREIILAIPVGDVLSYGEVAALAGVPNARQVGRLLSEDGQDLPWHRVLRADGTPTPHLAAEQLARLRAEGVTVINGRVRRSDASAAEGPEEVEAVPLADHRCAGSRIGGEERRQGQRGGQADRREHPHPKPPLPPAAHLGPPSLSTAPEPTASGAPTTWGQPHQRD